MASRPADSRVGVDLFRIAGIQIRVHYSWLIIFLLIVWSLSAGYLPRTYPGRSAGAYWAAGAVATLFFFASVLFHELCHSLTAKRFGIAVPDITLFVFGGVSHIAQEAEDPRTELTIAVVGPLSSFLLAAVFWGATRFAGSGAEGLTPAVLRYLSWVNLALGVFNLIPGFPLDGGRVLRAVLWWKTESYTRATRWASDIGKGFAVALMILGAVQIFGGALIGGLWLIFIGIFLRGVAEGSYQQTVVRKSLEGVRVGDVMVESVVTVSPEVTVRDLIRNYFLHYGYKGFPVIEDGKLVGVVSLEHVRHVPDEEQERTTVGAVMRDATEDIEIGPETSLAGALRKMGSQQAERLLVVEGERLEGLITKTGLNRFIEIRQILEQ